MSLPAAREIVHAFIDFLFPPACPVCGGTVEPENCICPGCQGVVTEQALNYHSPVRHIENVQDITILLPCDATCRCLVHHLKYHNMPALGLVLGDLLARKYCRSYPIQHTPHLVPVPLHPAKQHERGYNQSEKLAEGFAALTGWEIRTDLVERLRYTGTQTALDQDQRIENVKNAFSYRGTHLLAGHPVIIIDDVMTTGSTLSECAGALRAGGAGTIGVCVVATPDIGAD